MTGSVAAVPLFAVGIDVAGAKLAILPRVAVLPTAVLAVYLLIGRRGGERLAGAWRWKRWLAIAGLTVGLAFVTTVAAAGIGTLTGSGTLSSEVRGAVAALGFVSTFVGTQSLLGAVGVVGLQYLMLSSADGIDRRTVIQWSVLPGTAALALALPLLGVEAAPVRGYATMVGLLVPLSFMPLSVTDRRRERLLLVAVILAGPTMVGIGFAPFGEFGQRYGPVVLVPWALVSGAVGLAGYAAGLSLDATADPSPADD